MIVAFAFADGADTPSANFSIITSIVARCVRGLPVADPVLWLTAPDAGALGAPAAAPFAVSGGMAEGVADGAGAGAASNAAQSSVPLSNFAKSACPPDGAAATGTLGAGAGCATGAGPLLAMGVGVGVGAGTAAGLAEKDAQSSCGAPNAVHSSCRGPDAMAAADEVKPPEGIAAGANEGATATGCAVGVGPKPKLEYEGGGTAIGGPASSAGAMCGGIAPF